VDFLIRASQKDEFTELFYRYAYAQKLRPGILEIDPDPNRPELVRIVVEDRIAERLIIGDLERLDAYVVE
jgi:hypothetical protein